MKIIHYTVVAADWRIATVIGRGGWGDVATMMGRVLYKLPPAYSSSILPAQLGAVVVVVVVVGLTVIKTYSELGTRDNCRHNLRHCFPRPTKEFISLQNGQHPPPPLLLN